MLNQINNIDRQTWLRTSFILILSIIAFWAYQTVMIGLIFLLVVVGVGAVFTPKIQKVVSLPYTWVDLFLTILIGTEVLNYVFSVYQPNTALFFEKTLFFILFYFFLRVGFKFPYVKEIFLLGFSAFIVLIVLIACLNFTFLQSSMKGEGWSDTSQLKSFFVPFGLLTNEWATLSICFLPFPLIAAVLLSPNIKAVIGSLVAFSLVIFSVLISFSRGAYLCVAFFGIVAAFLILLKKSLTINTLGKVVLLVVLTTSVLIATISTPFLTTLSMNKTVRQQRSTSGRIAILKSGIAHASIQPLTGIGNDNYPIINSVGTNLQEDQGTTYLATTTYLQLAVEKGIIGSLLYGALWLAIMYAYLQSFKQSKTPSQRLVVLLLISGFLGLCCRELFFSTLFFSDKVFVLACIFSAFAIPTDFSITKTYNTKAWIGLAFVVLVLSGWVFLNKYTANRASTAITEAETLWQGGQSPKAFKKVEEAIALSPKVVPYYELAGLIKGQNASPISQLTAENNPTDKQNINEAIKYFEKTSALSPNDAGYHFNLGWLYFMNNRHDSKVLTHLQKAVALSPITPEYHFGSAIIYESLQRKPEALLHFEKAVRLDPELLDSEIFINLNQRDSALATSVINNSLKNLQAKLDSSYNTIIAARVAKLLLNAGKTAEARALLLRVNSELPELNRPYCYLARISIQQGDTTTAIKLLKKAKFLSNNDYMPEFMLADFYDKPNPDKRTIYSIIHYYQSALTLWIGGKSSHRGKSERAYKQGISIKNDLIPKRLLLESRMKVDFKKITQRMSQLYLQTNRKELSDHYAKLSAQDPIFVTEADFKITLTK